ncbi:hypothetical protein BT96DRAFT_892869 [Gymnopus androsaceus JB14]|uniref:Uncharacterized protein n=1 Tax=Gymnopus androsaceus JB14 TaxID=1447944 RepID=A0A6A4GDA2_9AGAR|nr:hypothetical protein BT96DRAFT_892869 [Gymnopus androsaceus JB14]
MSYTYQYFSELRDLRYKAVIPQSYKQLLESLVPRPTNATLPSVPLSSLAAHYNDPAYGNLELCAVDSSLSSHNMSSSCKNLLHDLPLHLPGVTNHSVPTLFARFDSFWIAHLRLEHFNGNLFNVTGYQSATIKDPKQPYWARKATGESPITAEFVYDSEGVVGFGITGGFWGPVGMEVEDPKGKTVKERAEVWYSRK